MTFLEKDIQSLGIYIYIYIIYKYINIYKHIFIIYIIYIHIYIIYNIYIVPGFFELNT